MYGHISRSLTQGEDGLAPFISTNVIKSSSPDWQPGYTELARYILALELLC